MPQRKPWTPEQDSILKYLKEERGEKKWSCIAKIMEQQFGIKGKTGKQCRERYHNHVDSSVTTAKWTQKEDQILYQMHESIGNKWSLIAQHLPGRTDNCVKNHFYSKLRKVIRRINKIVCDQWKKDYREIKMCTLYKIVETNEQRFKLNSKINEDIVEESRALKNTLFAFEQDEKEQKPQNLDKFKDIFKRIYDFQEKMKKNKKKTKEHKGSTQTNYSKNHDQDHEKFVSSGNKSKEELPLYQILKRVCEEIMLDSPQ